MGLFARIVAVLMGGSVSLQGVLKVFLLGTFLAGLGVIMHNVIVSLVGDALEWMRGELSSQEYALQGQYVMSLTGPTAWLAVQMHFPQAFAAIYSAVAIRVVLRCIPFVGLGK